MTTTILQLIKQELEENGHTPTITPDNNYLFTPSSIGPRIMIYLRKSTIHLYLEKDIELKQYPLENPTSITNLLEDIKRITRIRK